MPKSVLFTKLVSHDGKLIRECTGSLGCDVYDNATVVAEYFKIPADLVRPFGGRFYHVRTHVELARTERTAKPIDFEAPHTC
jgi:hypothetical protein